MTNLYDFTVKAQDGTDISLSKYQGKVLLVVNTATGCGLTPQYEGLQKLYDTYHDKGFEIVGVSMDNDKESWLQAIKDDGLTWIQLSDLAYWNTKPRELYNVSYIPQNVLVDSEGKIIATKLDEAGLEEVLDEYLGE